MKTFEEFLKEGYLENKLRFGDKALADMSTNMTNFTKYLAKMTQSNDHTGARLAIAKYVNDEDLITGYTNILAVRNSTGSLDPKAMRKRDEMDTKLFKSLKDIVDPSDFKKIMSAL